MENLRATVSALSLPYKVSVVSILAVLFVGLFAFVESSRRLQTEETERARALKKEPRLVTDPRDDDDDDGDIKPPPMTPTSMMMGAIVLNLFPTFLVALTFLEADMPFRYRCAAVGVAFLPTFVLDPILNSKLCSKLFTLLTHKYAFGGRGCVLTVAAALALALSLTKTTTTTTSSSIVIDNHVAHYLQFLSLECFAMAAWFACGLGSVAGWAAHPEYGDFARSKKFMLMLVQIYFIWGFALHAVAALKAAGLGSDEAATTTTKTQ